MSVCDEYVNGKMCPCIELDEYDYAWGCSLDMWGIHFDPGVPPASCSHSAALRAVAENPESVLVAVPPEVQSLVGWRPRFHPLIEHDPLTGTTRFSDEQHSGPDTEMVWHWIRGQDR